MTPLIPSLAHILCWGQESREVQRSGTKDHSTSCRTPDVPTKCCRALNLDKAGEAYKDHREVNAQLGGYDRVAVDD